MYIIWGLPYSVGLKLLDSHARRTAPEGEQDTMQQTFDTAQKIDNVLEETGFNKIKELNHGQQGRTQS